MSTARLNLAFPYLLVALLAGLVLWSNLGGDDPVQSGNTGEQARQDGSADGRAIDPVCNMDVNRAWGIQHTHEGKDYFFCHDRCREAFAADPAAYVTEKCLVCQEPVNQSTAVQATYLGNVYYLNSEACRREFKADPAGFFMHRMWGLPNWLYYLSIAVILLLSFLLFEGVHAFRRRDSQAVLHANPSKTDGRDQPSERGRPNLLHRLTAQWRSSVPDSAAPAAGLSLPILGQSVASEHPASATHSAGQGDRLDLMQFRPLNWLFKSRPTRFAIQLFMAVAFLLIIAAGLFGNQNPALNIAPLLTWTIWWCGLVVLIMFAGKAWCFMCPWDAIARWMEKLRLWKKRDQGLGLGMKWPRRLRNIWLATFLFIGLTWLELGFGITMKPAATAYMAIAMLVLTIVCAFLFDRQSFCRYGCLVGRVSGLYAMFGGVEVRSVDADVCQNCKTKECIRGSEEAYGCPTHEYPGKMDVNTYCIQCNECLQSCPHENMTVRLRPWGQDLAQQSKPRSDEAYLALLMLAISGFHGLTMTPVWGQMTDAISGGLSAGRILSFSIGMTLLLAGPILVYAGLVWLSYRLSSGTSLPDVNRTTYRDYFIRYAYCVLPIALFYHLAHNLEHLLMEGPKVVALTSDPFGWGWNLFGTAGWHVPPLASLEVLWILQVILVAVGHIYSLWAARNISRGLFSNTASASRGQWPMLVGMIAFSIFSLWLLKQPMEMRTSAM